MAQTSIPAPSTPSGSSHVPSFSHSFRLEHGLDTSHGTAHSSVSGLSAPNTPHDVTAARLTELRGSSLMSDPSCGDTINDREGSSQPRPNSPSIKIEETSGQVNDPFMTSNSSSQETPYRPRPDRLGVEITPELAQAIFPSDACVFVANLVASKPDEVIREAVIEAFSAFGNCYVKVKRDNSQMPYAFCQYEKVEDSNRAIVEGRTMLILGRPCRTERAKVNRSLYLSRRTGGSISEEEARRALVNMGDIQSIWVSTATDIEMFRLPDGIWVQFAFFQDSRDAAQAFKENPEYRLEQPQLPDDLRAKLSNARNHATPSRIQTPVRQGPFNTPASRYSQVNDATSIFIGNLNSSVTLDSLRAIFGKFGVIRNIEIVCRPGVAGNSVHAFVEYDSPRAADRAMNAEHVLGHIHLRVERRQSTPLSLARSQSSRFSNSNGSPRRRSYASSNSTMPSTPFSGGFYPPEFGRPIHGNMGGDNHYPMHPNMSPFFPGPYLPAHNSSLAAMSGPAHPMVYGSPASTHFQMDNGFGPHAFQGVAPPPFALPQMPMMMGAPLEPKSGILPTVPEHQGQ